jgi:serine/threonine protein kinase
MDAGFRARFRREVDASRAVSGAYTASVVDADPEAEVPWLASVFVPGPSLRQTLDSAGPLPEEAVLRLAAGLAGALADIHRAGLVHRDVKPSNVLLAADGPRVIDFGIARAADGEGGRGELTRSGWLVGSPGFVSPEQAEGRELAAASDVFSLGSGGQPIRWFLDGAHAVQHRAGRAGPGTGAWPAAPDRPGVPCQRPRGPAHAR